MAFKATPLPHEYMIVGFIGFFITIYIGERWLTSFFALFMDGAQAATVGVSLNFALILMFLILIIASIVSAENARTDEATLDLLVADHYKRGNRKTLKRR